MSIKNLYQDYLINDGKIIFDQSKIFYIMPIQIFESTSLIVIESFTFEL